MLCGWTNRKRTWAYEDDCVAKWTPAHLAMPKSAEAAHQTEFTHAFAPDTITAAIVQEHRACEHHMMQMLQ
eukprot:6187703-Pleurochrysis_carterae.AAC.1